MESYYLLSTVYPLAFYTALCQYIVMVCIYCKHKTQVINSRPQRKPIGTWRRRKCLHCSSVFTSKELPDLESSLRVRAISGALSPFYRDKLFISLLSSLSHRQSSLKDAASLTDTIIGKLQGNSKAGVIEAPHITKEVLGVLRRFDKAACTHYLAHHSTKD